MAAAWVRKIVHPDETKADLQFLIPNGATTAVEIPITLAYFNQPIETEGACDHSQSWASDVGINKSAIAFYHAKIGTARKRELEQLLGRAKFAFFVVQMRWEFSV
ncbi:hypothetical protein B0H14DRAFT_2585314 [Mycena olivaceomarginata]|nr:hypothetical protein B0H14DRAFT_2585314 [Mycena olivaceomarginata]